MIPFLELIRSGEILTGDGAMGTMLFERGLTPGECPEKWNTCPVQRCESAGEHQQFLVVNAAKKTKEGQRTTFLNRFDLNWQ